MKRRGAWRVCSSTGHGTLSLYAALDVGTGQVAGMTAARHTSADFLAFLDQLVARYRRRRAIHVILDIHWVYRDPTRRIRTINTSDPVH